MPNIQFSVTSADFVSLFSAGELLGLSEGRLAKALCLAFIKHMEPTPGNLMRLVEREKKAVSPREML